MLPSHIVVDCQKGSCPNHHSTTANMPSLTCVGMSLVQKKYLSMFNSFIMTENWLKQTKSCPATLLLIAKNEGAPNHHSTPAKISSLTGVGMNVGQMKHSYLCLTAFIMTEPWLKKPKMLPSHIVVECQIMKLHQQPQNIYKNAFHDRHRNEFGSNKKF